MASGAAALKEHISPGQKHERVIYTWDMPPKYNNEIQSIGMVELTAEEELICTKRARNDGMRLAYELAKQSLVHINGKKLDQTGGDADKMWNRMAPKVRNLVITAYAEIHTPADDDVENFRATRKAQV